jgi:heme oxygenase (biliverdin-IX-beta and delta-forming)
MIGAMTAMAGLRAATWTSHQRLEKRLDIKTRFTIPTAYRAHLERMWGFCAPLEPRIASSLEVALDDYPARRKLPLLARDLRSLGLSADSIESLPRCLLVPDCPGAPEAFGCAYVLEGATLGGRTLLPLAQSRLGVTAEHGASFLASYGACVDPMWRVFGAAVEAHCADSAPRERAAAAAVATFEALDRWLCAEPRV